MVEFSVPTSNNNTAVLRTPLPMYQIASVICIQMCEGVNINVLFPFIAFMVEDMGYSGKKLGIYAGIA